MSSEAREMTLDEWVDRLPLGHRAHKELAALRAAPSPGAGETLVWLIETGASPTTYWDGRNADTGFTDKADEACRFSRFEDAETVRCWLIPNGHRFCRSVQHMWIAQPSAVSASPASPSCECKRKVAEAVQRFNDDDSTAAAGYLVELIEDALGPLPDVAETPDEEYRPHSFTPQEGAATDGDGPIWCDVCDYHRDHAIHSAPSPAAGEPAETRPPAFSDLSGQTWYCRVCSTINHLILDRCRRCQNPMPAPPTPAPAPEERTSSQSKKSGGMPRRTLASRARTMMRTLSIRRSFLKPYQPKRPPRPRHQSRRRRQRQTRRSAERVDATRVPIQNGRSGAC
jgi:rubredoxin